MARRRPLHGTFRPDAAPAWPLRSAGRWAAWPSCATSADVVTFGPADAAAQCTTMKMSAVKLGVIAMRAVVVSKSMYGNTHPVADAIGAGLRTAFDIRAVPVSLADPEVLADAALVVVGGPTHARGMSRTATRRAAVEAANKPVSGLKVEPGAGDE